MRVEQRIGRCDDIDEDGAAAGLQHPPRLAQAGFHILPVMRGEAAEHDVEGGIREGQPLRRRLPGDDIGEAALRRRGGDGVQHGRCHVAGDDLGDMRRRAVADMAAAAAQIQHAGRGLPAHPFSIRSRSSPLPWTALVT